MPVFESERSWGLAGEWLPTNVSFDVSLERLKGPLLGYVVTLEEKVYDFFFPFATAAAKGVRPESLSLAVAETPSARRLFTISSGHLLWLGSEGNGCSCHADDFRPSFRQTRRRDKIVVNGVEMFAEVHRLINAVRYNCWFV